MGGSSQLDVVPDPKPATLLSYAHRDDEAEGQTTRISKLCTKLLSAPTKIEAAFETLAGRHGADVCITRPSDGLANESTP